MNQTKPIDEIIQSIKDDAIADHKGWQGSPYEAKRELADLILGLPSLKPIPSGIDVPLEKTIRAIRQEIAEALGVES